MKNIAVGTITVLTLAMLSYASLLAFDRKTPPARAAQTPVQRSPEEIAARDRMAQLVAEVAARSAAQTAKAVVMSHRQQQQATEATEEKTASR